MKVYPFYDISCPMSQMFALILGGVKKRGRGLVEDISGQQVEGGEL